MYLNYSRSLVYLSELNTQEFLSSQSLPSSGSRQIVNNTHIKGVKYMVCYEKKKSKEREIRDRENSRHFE